MAYILTPLGKSSAIHLGVPHDLESSLLVYMYEHPEPLEVDELVGELNSTETAVLREISRQLNKASPYVKEV